MGTVSDCGQKVLGLRTVEHRTKGIGAVDKRYWDCGQVLGLRTRSLGTADSETVDKRYWDCGQKVLGLATVRHCTKGIRACHC